MPLPLTVNWLQPLLASVLTSADKQTNLCAGLACRSHAVTSISADATHAFRMCAFILFTNSHVKPGSEALVHSEAIPANIPGPVPGMSSIHIPSTGFLLCVFCFGFYVAFEMPLWQQRYCSYIPQILNCPVYTSNTEEPKGRLKKSKLHFSS